MRERRRSALGCQGRDAGSVPAMLPRGDAEYAATMKTAWMTSPAPQDDTASGRPSSDGGQGSHMDGVHLRRKARRADLSGCCYLRIRVMRERMIDTRPSASWDSSATTSGAINRNGLSIGCDNNTPPFGVRISRRCLGGWPRTTVDTSIHSRSEPSTPISVAKPPL